MLIDWDIIYNFYWQLGCYIIYSVISVQYNKDERFWKFKKVRMNVSIIYFSCMFVLVHSLVTYTANLYIVMHCLFTIQNQKIRQKKWNMIPTNGIILKYCIYLLMGIELIRTIRLTLVELINYIRIGSVITFVNVEFPHHYLLE